MLGDFEEAEVVATVEVVGCPADTIEVEVKRAFKGPVLVGDRLDICSASCGALTVRNRLIRAELGRRVAFFGQTPEGGGNLEPVGCQYARTPWARYSGHCSWIAYADLDEEQQIEELLGEEAGYQTDTADGRRRTLHEWLRSRNQRLRLAGLYRVKASGTPDEYVEELFKVLESRSSSSHVRSVAVWLLEDKLERRKKTHGRFRYDTSDPLYDRLVAAQIRLVESPPARGDDAIQTALTALAGLVSLRETLEAAPMCSYHYDGSSSPPKNCKRVKDCPAGVYGVRCDRWWYEKHGQAAARTWRKWYERGDHLRSHP